jgi:uncharacterized protein YjbI with pentapeptide repeats
VTSDGINLMIDSIENSPTLTSLGLDFGGLDVNQTTLKRLNDVISSKDNLVSLALGFHKTENLSNEIIASYLNTIEARLDKLRMLRLNFSNTKISRANIERLHEILKKSEITHLELFLGGTKEIDNELASKFVHLFKELYVRGFEFDVGYSNCDGSVLEKFDFSHLNLTRCAFYVNG